MAFFEIEAFIRTSERDASYAAAILGKNELEVCLAIERLQKLLFVELFSDSFHPSRNTLTDCGRIYLEYARAALFELQNGILITLNHKYTTSKMTLLSIKLSHTIGKEIVSSSLLSLLNNDSFKNVCLDVVATSSSHDKCPLQFFIVFGHLSPNFKQFFTTKWSAVITQGLYASEKYIKDVGNPHNVHDLLDHTVIVYGDSFHDIYDSPYNWHLRNDYGIPKFVPSIVLNNQLTMLSAINANLGIGPSFCYQSQHLVRVLPWISGPAATLDFSIRKDIPEELHEYIDVFDDVIQSRLRSFGIELIPWTSDQ